MITIRAMRAADLDLGLRLCRQAGWNQVEADWRRFLALQPDGCFVAELGGTPVATTTTCLFGPIAWIAMVLVEVNVRRRGVATALLKHALSYLDGQGVSTVRLDATAAGQPVYEKLGFAPEYQLTRYEGIARSGEDVACITEATAALYPEMAVFDHRMTGTQREKMLTRLFAEAPQAVRVLRRHGRLDGFVTIRRGANADQIGPCIASSEAGPVLLGDALSRCAGRPVFLDIPRDNTRALQIAEIHRLRAQRHFTRMCRGARVRDCVAGIWAGSGPEKG
jgi:GNAT superfamily N-acetyltransferase